LNPTVLVTGGGGFIGSNTIEALLRCGKYEVRVLDNFSTGHRHNLEHLAEDVHLVEGDVRDMETVEEAVSGVNAILHLAALPSVPRSVKAPITSNDVNAGGTLKLLSAAHRAGVQRVVLASSSSVYGANATLPKREDMLPAPVSPYAASKLAAEHYIGVFARTYGMHTLSIRYFNVFGPRQDPASQYSGVVARFMTAGIRGETCTVFGDGSQSRDFTYVGCRRLDRSSSQRRLWGRLDGQRPARRDLRRFRDPRRDAVRPTTNGGRAPLSGRRFSRAGATGL
jgi:nucleoside-diphosphate-sugar epimerase